MRRIRFNDWVCVVALACANLPDTASAQARTSGALNVSEYSDITRHRCGGGRAVSDHAVVTERCRLIDGFRSEAIYRGTSVQFRLRGRGEEGVVLGAGYGVGDAIEWRGARARGRFVPQAAIVRLQSRNPEGRLVSTFAILRVEGHRLCKAGFLDGNAASANARARAAADRIGQNFRCGRDTAEVIGPETASLREIVERSR